TRAVHHLCRRPLVRRERGRVQGAESDSRRHDRGAPGERAALCYLEPPPPDPGAVLGSRRARRRGPRAGYASRKALACRPLRPDGDLHHARPGAVSRDRRRIGPATGTGDRRGASPSRGAPVGGLEQRPIGPHRAAVRGRPHRHLIDGRSTNGWIMDRPGGPMHEPAEIRGERVTLRHMVRADVDEMAQWPRFSEPDLQWANLELSFPSDRDAYFERGRTNANRRRFAIRDEDEELIGTVGLRNLNFRAGQGTLGIIIRADAVGKGYGTDAIRSTLRYAF